MLRYLTAGESHGKALIALIDGVPAGLIVDKKKVDNELTRRMFVYGRGKRMSIESDSADILSGLRKNRTIGSPVAILIKNIDSSIDRMPVVLEPRPGHADLSGILKYGLKDVRDVLERASARETAARVSAGAIAKILLADLGITVASHVTLIGGVGSNTSSLGIKQIVTISEKSPVRCADPDASKAMCEEIRIAADAGDTLGGVFEVIVHGVPPGLGSHTQWDRRIDANLARAVMSIQAVKGVGFGIGFDAASNRGSMVHDEIFYEKSRGYFRKTNRSGGIEGGMTTGEDIVIRAVMKPIATLKKPLASVNIKTKKKVLATVERSDVCAVPAAGVVGEAVTAIEIANAVMEKFGCDSMREIKRNMQSYAQDIKRA